MSYIHSKLTHYPRSGTGMAGRNEHLSWAVAGESESCYTFTVFAR